MDVPVDLKDQIQAVGIMITTSYISKQAYDEVKEDGHPIILITGRDIVRILRSKHYSSENIDMWLDSIKEDINLDSPNPDDNVLES